MDFPSVSHIVVISCSLQPRLRETKSFVTKDFPSESSDWSPADVATVQSLAQYLLFSINPFPICINCIKCVWRQSCDQSPGSHTVSVVDLQGSVNCSFNCRLVTTSWRQDASLVRERESSTSQCNILWIIVVVMAVTLLSYVLSVLGWGSWLLAFTAIQSTNTSEIVSNMPTHIVLQLSEESEKISPISLDLCWRRVKIFWWVLKIFETGWC